MELSEVTTKVHLDADIDRLVALEVTNMKAAMLRLRGAQNVVDSISRVIEVHKSRIERLESLKWGAVIERSLIVPPLQE
jgi:hypothetical protein